MIKVNAPTKLLSLACDSPYEKIVGSPEKFNVYNYKVPCVGNGCYENLDNNVQKFLNRTDVQ